jgi:sialate O-acetylesterase
MEVGMIRRILVFVFLFVICGFSARAEIVLPKIIGNNMVLQRNENVIILGEAEPGENITVSFCGQKVSAVSDKGGQWKVKMGPFKAGGPFEMKVSGNTDEITVNNVLIGDVWVCSGQSNMQLGVSEVLNAAQEIANADNPNIRLLTIPLKVSDTPQSKFTAKWLICGPKTVRPFSATAYFFGKELQKELNIPIGLINSSWGGTPIAAWMSAEAFGSDPDFRLIHERSNNTLSDYKLKKEEYEQKKSEWMELAEKAQANSDPLPSRPKFPEKPPYQILPSYLYNAMISPLISYPIKGAIWYQGEADAAFAYQYRKLFPAMIEDWRNAWGQGDFPFLFVQLANYMQSKRMPSQSAWAELREAQSMTLSCQNTGMAVTIDIGNPTNIHPKNKQEVGRRLALAALSVAYGRKIVYSGPIYELMEITDNKIYLSFNHIGSGLMAKSNEPLSGFAIAGEDRKFVWANAEIEGDKVVVWSDDVWNPVAVRYAWGDNPVCNLYNKEGLPASPFRTDNWPGITINNK